MDVRLKSTALGSPAAPARSARVSRASLMLYNLCMADDSVFRHLFKASTIGIHLVVATFVGLAIGHFLDKFLGTKPWLTFIFLGLGIFTGFRDMFLIVRKEILSQEDQSYPKGEEPRGDWDDDEEGR